MTTEGVDPAFLLEGLEEEEEQDLHPSHDWGERRFSDGDGTRWIPTCLDCTVDGFVNEPKAFKKCPGPKIDREPCDVRMWSVDDPGHQHRCIGDCHTDHYCKECRRWYNVRPDSPLAVS